MNISWIPSGLYHDVIFDFRVFDQALVPIRKLIGDGYQIIVSVVRSRPRASAPKDLKEVTSAGEATGWARSNRKSSSSLGDQPGVDLFLSSLETLPEPFDAHLHLVETHTNVKASWENFDNTVRAADEYFEQIVSWLERRGMLDNTLIVISSDHSRTRKLYVRVPLMIYFPKGEHARVVDSNVQLLDLAPTMLSYLGEGPWTRIREGAGALLP